MSAKPTPAKPPSESARRLADGVAPDDAEALRRFAADEEAHAAAADVAEDVRELVADAVHRGDLEMLERLAGAIGGPSVVDALELARRRHREP